MMPEQKPGRSIQIVQTPPELIHAVRALLGVEAFSVDLAATEDNRQAPLWMGPGSLIPDALAVAWEGLPGWTWLNPPYADIAPWLSQAARAGAAGCRVAALVPASVGANWWTEHVHGKARALALSPRVTFVGHDHPFPKDLALLLYDRAGGCGIQPWRWDAVR